METLPKIRTEEEELLQENVNTMLGVVPQISSINTMRKTNIKKEIIESIWTLEPDKVLVPDEFIITFRV